MKILKGGLVKWPRLRRTLRNCISTLEAEAEEYDSASIMIKDLEYAIPASERIFIMKSDILELHDYELLSLISCVEYILNDKFSFDEMPYEERLRDIMESLLESR